MKNRWLKRIGVSLLCLALAGCSAAPVEPAPENQRYPTSDTALEVVDHSSAADNLSYQPESPAIGDEGALSAQGDIAVQETSILFRDDDGGSSTSASVDEVKSIWISYLEMQTLLTGQTQAGFTANISTVFDNVKNFGLNTVVVQVRPFGDALYNSSYFPWSYIITGAEGVDPGFDPLAIMVTEAKSRGLRIEAWVNPYRIRAAGNNNALSSDNPAQASISAGDGMVISYGGMISYNPSSAKARELIVNGVAEIARNYNVDAIHIDDYFYPTTDAAFDSAYYAAYQNNGGTMSLGDWRRGNVEELMKAMYAGIKQADSTVLFGISPQGNIDNNYNGQYLDVRKIVSTTGYCDYVCPQVYYGFQNEAQPYAQVVKTWNDMIGGSGVKLYVGIGAYKLGLQDQWAGSGVNEWVDTTTQLKDMVESARVHGNYTGFVLYRYDSLFRPQSYVRSQVEQELESLKSVM